MSNKVTDLIVYETENYDQFSFLDQNRKVTNNNPLRISIQEDNKLKFNPIICNANMEVIDGQHRLSIAKELKVPIYYIIDQTADVKDIQSLNVGHRNWSQSNHMEYHASQGNPDYKFMRTLVNDFNISISALMLAYACYVGESKKESVNSIFKRGKFRFNKPFPNVLDDVQKYNDIMFLFTKFTTSKRLSREGQHTLLNLVQEDEYDHNRFLRAIENYPDDFMTAMQFKTRAAIRERIIALYNKGKRKKLLKI